MSPVLVLLEKVKRDIYSQGRDEVYLFVTDSIFTPNFDI